MRQGWRSLPEAFAKEVPSELGSFCWESRPTPGVLFVTYATDDYLQYVPTLKSQTDALHARLLVFTPHMLPEIEDIPTCDVQFKNHWDSSPTPCLIPQYQGTQCFKWKSVIVNRAFKNLTQSEDVVVYMDVRTLITGDLRTLIDDVRQHGSAFYGHIGKSPIVSVKREVWDFLHMDPTNFDWNTAFKISGAALAVSKNSPLRQQVLDRWEEMSNNPHLLCNCRNSKDLPEYDAFVTHQHDQALLAALCMNIKDTKSPCKVWNDDEEHSFLTTVSGFISFLETHNITCGFMGSCALSADCKKQLCHDDEGYLADRKATPEFSSMMKKYMFVKKMRTSGRGEPLSDCRDLPKFKVLSQ